MISVDFKINLNRLNLINEISNIDNPQVVFWYFGEYGLREQGVNYYKKDFRKIRQLENNPALFLYDLTAWKAFRNKNESLDGSNPNVRVIDSFNIQNLYTLTSAKFFKWIRTEQRPNINSYVKNVLFNRQFIFNKSESFPNIGIQIRDIFPEDCLMISDQKSQDTGKSYSAFQYLEICSLIMKLVKKNIQKPEINIVFALPNDEWKYYKNQSDPSDTSLVQDLSFLLNEKFSSQLNDKKINISFFCFQFNKDSRNRPYNTGNKNIDITDHSQIV